MKNTIKSIKNNKMKLAFMLIAIYGVYELHSIKVIFEDAKPVLKHIKYKQAWE